MVSNPLDEQYVSKHKLDYSEKVTRFIAAGRVCEQKNYPLMIKAFAKAVQDYPDITLKIYGDGDNQYKESLYKLIEELGMTQNIFLCGKTKEIDAEFRKSDAYIMSSDYEGMPNSLAEAMATGLVCISTDCRTGPKDLIDHGVNGLLTKVNDESAMKEAIVNVCKMNSEEARAIGNKAREKALYVCGNDCSLNKLISII